MDTVRKLFKKIEPSLCREDFESEIFQAIAAARTGQLKRRVAVSYVGLLFSGVAILSAGLLYGGAFLGSEFWSVIALLFSDAAIVAGDWNNFVFLLLETVPVVPILLLLVPTFIFLLFLSMYVGATERRQYSY
ncbi:MAG: hypothetical protein WAV46_01060 [Candidatus Moraniibacteriota bacterium]